MTFHIQYHIKLKWNWSKLINYDSKNEVDNTTVSCDWVFTSANTLSTPDPNNVTLLKTTGPTIINDAVWPDARSISDHLQVLLKWRTNGFAMAAVAALLDATKITSNVNSARFGNNNKNIVLLTVSWLCILLYTNDEVKTLKTVFQYGLNLFF